MLIQWLSHDVLALAGPALATLQVLFDFIVAELAAREIEDAPEVAPFPWTGQGLAGCGSVCISSS